MNIQLSLAIGGYDHVRDLLDGRVRAPGIELIPFELPIEEVTFRFTRFAEWDVSELSFGKTVSLLSQDNPQIVPIPVFPSRVFRHSAIYVGEGKKIKTPKDLEGRRVGIPEWAQTAGIYVRGLLQHEYGVDLSAVDWYQAGVRQPGRTEKVALKLPKGLRLTPMTDKSLSGMLRSGELDAVISARAPGDGGQPFARMFPDYQALELAYFRKTRIFPIMHVVVLKKSTYERDRWIAMNLVQAFEAAKNRSLARTTELGVSRSLAGEDFWPYGAEPNRPTLDAYLQYAFEQGVCHRRLTLEDLFAPETREQAKI
jgi:4,5-dihydroxyphthalate decarboxylase